MNSLCEQFTADKGDCQVFVNEGIAPASLQVIDLSHKEERPTREDILMVYSREG